jgi:LmbE family N-acetylglucosaminyl deacetylase
MRIFGIFAHPDDKSYGPSGTLLHYAAKNADISLLTLTHGENGSLGPCKNMTKQEVMNLRRSELECAANVIGVKDLEIHHFPNGKLSSISDIEGIDFIKNRIEDKNPDIILTFHENGITGHHDHITTTNWVYSAIQSIKFIPSLYFFGISESYANIIHGRKLYPIPRFQITHKIDVSEFVNKKMTAIKCHDSQMEIFNKIDEVPGRFKRISHKELFAKVWPKTKQIHKITTHF